PEAGKVLLVNASLTGGMDRPRCGSAGLPIITCRAGRMTYQQPARDVHQPELDAIERPSDRQRPAKRHRGGYNVDKMLDAAREKIEGKRWKEAANLLKRVLSTEPDNPIAAARLAFVCLYQNRPEDARKHISRALAAGPALPEV